jgi:hypothetical protein
MMVRSEVMRGRLETVYHAKRLYQKTAVNIKLQDVMHTFKKRHKFKSNSKHLVSVN